MCCDAPPPAYRGPGDSHSRQEWVWRHGPRFSTRLPSNPYVWSTPFYLYVPSARGRIADELPHAKLIVIVRDPIDRAYSNRMHLADSLDAGHQVVRTVGTSGFEVEPRPAIRQL